MAPVAERILARAIGQLHDCADAGKPNLPGVRVAAQIKIDARRAGFLEHLRGVSEEQLEPLLRYVLGSLPEVVAAEEMRVVDANHPQRGSRLAHRNRLVNQHPNAHRFQLEGYIRAVVIPENANHAMLRLNRAQNVPHPRINLIAGPSDVEPVVACEDAQIDGKPRKPLGQDFGQPVDAVDVEIAQVEKPKTRERRRQVFKFQPQLPDNRPEGVGSPPPIKADGLQRGLDPPGQKELVLKDEITAPMSPWTPVMECFDGAPPRQARFQRAAPGVKLVGLEQGGRVTIMEGRPFPWKSCKYQASS